MRDAPVPAPTNASTGFCRWFPMYGPMADGTIRVDRKQRSSEEIIEHLDAGKRVVVTVDVIGLSREVTLRKTGGEYVCDTGFKLLTYEDPADMRQCIERLQLTG